MFSPPEQLDELWAAYRVDRSDWRLRNRLVEHYLPFVHKLAGSYARKMRFRDKENAVGEVLAALVALHRAEIRRPQQLPRWARFCTKRKLIDQHRAERRAGASSRKIRRSVRDLNLLPDRDAHGRRPEVPRVYGRVERSAGNGTLAAVLSRHDGRAKSPESSRFSREPCNPRPATPFANCKKNWRGCNVGRVSLVFLGRETYFT